MNVEFIEPDDQRWPAVLAAVPHDYYHLPGYAAFTAEHIGGTACAFLGSNDDATLFIPLVLRAIPRELGAPDGWLDAASPYGYASPLTIAGKSPQAEAELWREFQRLCRDSSIVAAFLRLHPLLPGPTAGGAVGAVIDEGQTVFIDLTAPCEEVFRRFRENHRRDIRRLRNDGFATTIDDWSGLDRFVSLYRDTMRRVGADDEYLFDDEYFHGLAALADGKVHLGTVLAPDGRMAAAGLFLRCGGIVQFHLAGTAADFLSYAPTKLLFADMIRWASEQGCTCLHLGGGIGCRRDSLYSFKAGFSSERASYRSLRVVCAPETMRSWPPSRQQTA